MRFAALILLLFLCSVASAQSLKKALNAINRGKYEVASEQLYRILADDSGNPAAQFLLARMYDSQDYSGFNLDSANKYLLLSAGGLKKNWKEKELEKMQSSSGWREFTVTELQDRVNSQALRVAEDINTVEAWNHFINTYVSYPQMAKAVERRNELAFNEALKQNTAASMNSFCQSYPDAIQLPAAKSLYEKLLYQEATADSTWRSYKDFIDKYPYNPYAGRARENYHRLFFQDFTRERTVGSYVAFINEHPNSPYVHAAEDSVYVLSTRDNRVESYKTFISNFPLNRNVSRAWERIYQIETPLYTAETFRKFLAKYPDYPNPKRVQRDMRLATRQYERFKKDGLYGFLDFVSRDTVMRAQFIEAAPVFNGVAVVKLPCKQARCPYAYACVDGTIVTRYPWSEASDFFDGRALAAIGDCTKDSCKYGFINRFGEWVVKPIYDDAFEYNEGLALVRKSPVGYGYVNFSGEEVIPPSFADAGSFSEGLASAKSPDNGLYGFIDKTGKFVIPPQFSKAGSFSESLVPVADETGKWGYIDKTGKWVIKPQYEYALSFVQGRAKVMMRVSDPKNPKVMMLKDKMIDKKGRALKS